MPDYSAYFPTHSKDYITKTPAFQARVGTDMDTKAASTHTHSGLTGQVGIEVGAAPSSGSTRGFINSATGEMQIVDETGAEISTLVNAASLETYFKKFNSI